MGFCFRLNRVADRDDSYRLIFLWINLNDDKHHAIPDEDSYA
jgi:hypothetical protein